MTKKTHVEQKRTLLECLALCQSTEEQAPYFILLARFNDKVNKLYMEDRLPVEQLMDALLAAHDPQQDTKGEA